MIVNFPFSRIVTLIDRISVIITEHGSAGLAKFLHYMTSRDRIPPLGLEHKIEVEYFDNSNATFFADTCSFVLKVPTVHTTIEDFQEKLYEACDNYLGHGLV